MEGNKKMFNKCNNVVDSVHLYNALLLNEFTETFIVMKQAKQFLAAQPSEEILACEDGMREWHKYVDELDQLQSDHASKQTPAQIKASAHLVISVLFNVLP